MKTKHLFLSIATGMLFLLIASTGHSQTLKQVAAKESAIEVIQFHSEHRCMTCNKIEKLTRETLQNYERIPFSLVNVDDKKNEKKAEQFEATGTALFLYNAKTGKKKDLTEFAFMNAGNKVNFVSGLRKEIEQFGN